MFRAIWVLLVLGLCVNRPALRAAPLSVGAKFEHLQVGAITYHHAEVRSINARTVMISHDGGLASIRLRDLPGDLQKAFGYNVEAETAAETNLAAAQAEQQLAAEARQKNAPQKVAATNDSFGRLLQSFGRTPEIKARVDLRPQFFNLALNVKNQGPRPSCAVFAIVSALEFQNAEITGKPEQFSEEYLIWATSKLLHRATGAARLSDDDSEALDTSDIGFALSDVVAALRAYGIPLQISLPYNYSPSTTRPDPPAEVVDAAKTHNRVLVHPLPGPDQPAMLANLLHALDHGVPVPVGLRWPSWRAMHTGYLNTQIPQLNAGHAVTIVGYENKTGAIEDTVFIFKNSWGIRWGTGGYGFVTYHYLLKNMLEAVLLEIAPAPRTAAAALRR